MLLLAQDCTTGCSLQGSKYYIEGYLGIVSTYLVHLKVMPGAKNAS